MTPTDFEILAKRLLTEKLKENLRQDIQVNHKKKLTSLTGNTYEVDLSYSYSTFGIEYHTIGECKYWNSYITREKIGYFQSILDDLKAHKGIVFTTKGFQSGAITFAKSHGIGLIKITNDNYFEYYAHADGGIDKIKAMLNSVENLDDKINTTAIGIFYPESGPIDFIKTHYGIELANYLKNEYSSEMLDDVNYVMSPIVRKQLRALPDSWYEKYHLTETAGLGFTLENEPEMRILNISIALLKMIFLNNH